MKDTNEIINSIVNQSIKNVICVDDDFLEPYEEAQKSDDKKYLFSRQIYDAISTSCECAVTIIPYKEDTDVNVIKDKMRQKDLLILDWELTEVMDIERPIEIIDGALTGNVQYICIYTNAQNLEDVCETLRCYYSGYSKSEVTYIAAKCEEQGLLRDEFVDDIKECFEKRDGNIKSLKDKMNDYGVVLSINELGENYKRLWKMLYLAWTGKLLPEKSEFIVSQKCDESTVLNIDGRLVFVYGKATDEESGQINKIMPEKIIPSISKYMVAAPNSILDALWLYYFNIFQDALYKRTEFFKNISSDAFFYHASKVFEEEGRDDLEDFFKESFKEELDQRLDIKNISIPEEILKIMVDKGTSVEPRNILSELVKLNERITINRSLTKTPHNIAFGDLFQCIDPEDELCEFWLCITAKCDCRRPDKILKNYIFIGGRSCSNKHAIREAEKQYFSFLNLGTEPQEEAIAVKWCSKINSIYIKETKVEHDCIIQGNIRGMQKDFKYICNIKENFAQRMANMAFSDGNRVGISLAKI